VNSNKLISIVIPVYNEEKNIDRFKSELLDVLDSFGLNYEIICVEDGSCRDDSWGALKRFQQASPDRIRLFRHSRNFGMSGAYQTGFDNAKGEYVVVYASDLETPAKYIIDVVGKLEEGFDVINTNRVGRWGKNGFRKIPSVAANYRHLAFPRFQRFPSFPAKLPPALPALPPPPFFLLRFFYHPCHL